MTIDTPSRSHSPQTPDRPPTGRWPGRRGSSGCAVATAPAEPFGPSMSAAPASGRWKSRTTSTRSAAPSTARSRAPSARDLAVPRAAAGRRASGARSAGRLDAAAAGEPPRAEARASTSSSSRTTRATRASRSRTAPWPIAAAKAVEFGIRRSPAPRPATSPGRRLRLRPRSGCRPTSSSRPISSGPRSIMRSPTARRSCRSRHVRRRQPAVPPDRRRDRLGLRQHQPAAVLRRGQQDPRLRDRRVARLAGARCRRRADRVWSDVHKLAQGLRRARRARTDRADADPVRRRPGGRLLARGHGLGTRHDRRRADPHARHDRPIARDRQSGRRSLRRRAGGRQRRFDRGDPDAVTADAIRRVAALEGIYPETAGGVTLAAAEAARQRGVIRDGDVVVALLTGNGLKTPDARTFGTADAADDAVAGDSPAGARSRAVDARQPLRRSSAGWRPRREHSPNSTGPAGRPAAPSRSRPRARPFARSSSASSRRYPGLAPQLLTGDGERTASSTCS